jgi:hypothetical protein
MLGRNRLIRILSLTSAGVVAFACGPSESSSSAGHRESVPAYAADESAILYGTPTDESYPEVCAVAGYVDQSWIDLTGVGELGRLQAFCSGVLISPTVLATAGHCSWFAEFGFYTAAGVTCAPQIEPSTSLTTGHFVRHPDQEWFLGSPDVAVYVLDRPIKLKRYGRIPGTGALEDIFVDGERGPPVTLVGYGISESSNVADTRRETTAAFSFLDPDLGLVLSANPGLTSMHDSGSPAYLARSRHLLGTASSTGEIDGQPVAAYTRWDTAAVQDWLGPILHPDD